MNAAALLETAPTATPQLPCLPPPADGEASDQPFGELLEQVTAKSAAPVEESESDDEDAALLLDLPKTDEDDDDDAALANMIPLTCFCPPPEILPLTSPPPAEPVAEDVPVIEAAQPEVSTTSTDLDTDAPETENPSEQKQTLAQMVEPKKSEKLKAQETGKFELDPEVFDQVSEEDAKIIPVQISKAPVPSGPDSPKTPRDGTPAAQQVNVMKNSQKTAENAPVIEQKMPVREARRLFREAGPVVDRANVVAEFTNPESSAFQVDLSTDTTPVKAPEPIRLVESIRTEVANLRQRGDVSMTVVLKPDSGTEIQLQVSVARDGSIQATARCDRGDFHSLNAQWPQLQQSLATQGIQMTDLSNPGSSHQQPPQGKSDGSNFQNFDRGHNSQQRNPQPQRAFDEELAASTPRFTTQKTFQPAVAAPSRRWQSWA